MLERLFPFTFPKQRQQHFILLFAPSASGSAFAGLEGADSIANFPPQVWPVQDFDRFRKVLVGLGFDPVRFIAKYHLLHCLGGMLYLVAATL